MTGGDLFKRLLEQDRIVILLMTDENEQTFAAYRIGDEAMVSTLSELQKSAKEQKRIVCLDLSLMDEEDFAGINPVEELLS